jgi:hypothetical protein
MFEIPQPSMALNSDNVPPPDYEMYNSYKVAADTSPEHMIGWTATVAKGVEGGLRCLVFNSHGSPGTLHIGTGIRLADAAVFSALKGYVNTIFIVACRIAQTGSGGAFDGNLLCGAIAKAAGATVFCSTAYQSTGAYTVLGLPGGTIDEYEGVILKYSSNGSNKAVTNSYITSYVRNLKLGVRRTW